MATEPVTEHGGSQGPAAWEQEAERERVHGIGPWRLGLRRLRRNKLAIAFGILFVLLVAACLAAPLWAKHVAHTTPTANHLSDTIKLDGKTTNVVGLDGVPIGPTWQGEFFLGADRNGRDIMVRLLYGGRNSLMIGVAAALMTTILSILLGTLAGYFRGWSDVGIRSLLDIMWSFPVVILGVALGVALSLGGLKIGPLTIAGDSLAVPIFIIGLVYVPYMARPVRGQVLSLREKEFVEAARAQGAGPLRIMFTEVMPNLASTILVFFTLLIANAVLLEAALSFLGAGVRPPNPSWGTMIDEGVDRIATAPHLAIVPGVMLVLTVLSLNVFGDGVRDALDPRAKVRLEH
ncbi:MAG: peptide/nickel transport system permease protein [Thermoleophilaceae bacterium]|jgi:peptide/nickel transport system permease protein|nr:peptide/nickel transport system permease protein [Thermoleophilaceae bacterium]